MISTVIFCVLLFALIPMLLVASPTLALLCYGIIVALLWAAGMPLLLAALLPPAVAAGLFSLGTRQPSGLYRRQS